MWSVALLRSSKVVLEALSRNVDRFRWIQPKTVPLLDMVAKFLIVGGGIYFICVAWNVPLTSWLASAGIVGIAVGFAAKDTLANLFSGVFILADAPYKVGDFVVLDGGLRGQVQEIGIRSTRILTRDDVEVTVPNAVIGNGRIVNETGGPHDKMRVRVKVSAAYGSDVDQVRDVLLGCTEDAPYPGHGSRTPGSISGPSATRVSTSNCSPGSNSRSIAAGCSMNSTGGSTRRSTRPGSRFPIPSRMCM